MKKNAIEINIALTREKKAFLSSRKLYVKIKTQLPGSLFGSNPKLLRILTSPKGLSG